LSKNTFPKLAAAIFLIVAVAHALRLIFKWEVVIADWHVPMWLGSPDLMQRLPGLPTVPDLASLPERQSRSFLLAHKHHP